MVVDRKLPPDSTGKDCFELSLRQLFLIDMDSYRLPVRYPVPSSALEELDIDQLTNRVSLLS